MKLERAVGAKNYEETETLSLQESEWNKYAERSRVLGCPSLTISLFLIRSSFKTPAPCSQNSFN